MGNRLREYVFFLFSSFLCFHGMRKRLRMESLLFGVGKNVLLFGTFVLRLCSFFLFSSFRLFIFSLFFFFFFFFFFFWGKKKKKKKKKKKSQKNCQEICKAFQKMKIIMLAVYITKCIIDNEN